METFKVCFGLKETEIWNLGRLNHTFFRHDNLYAKTSEFFFLLSFCED